MKDHPARERWRQVGSDAPREEYFRLLREAVVEFYLADPTNPYQQSGRSSGAQRWEETRRVFVRAIHRSGDFLDVGCANGLLLDISSADRRNTMRSSRIVALVSMVLVSATPLLAKGGTIGIYAVVDTVAFEPDETSPERVRICGVFVVPVPMSSGRYKAPQRGCLYFRMAPGMERIAEHDWRDLKAFAGTGRGVGFAQYWVPNPADPSGNPHHSLEVHVWNEGDVVSPDVYPLPHGRGIVRTGDGADPDFERIVAELQRAARRD